MQLQLLVVWFGYYIFLVFVCISFGKDSCTMQGLTVLLRTINAITNVCDAACGLYYLAELIEEHINIAKKVLVNTIKSEVGLHFALLLWDRKPVVPLLLGAATHASYLRLLRQYPFIPVTADTSILSLGTPRLPVHCRETRLLPPGLHEPMHCMYASHHICPASFCVQQIHNCILNTLNSILISFQPVPYPHLLQLANQQSASYKHCLQS